MLASREVENIFENSDFVLMLNQAQGDRAILAKQLNISPQQMKYVTHTEAGEGLIFYGNVVLPFVDHFPKDTELYRIMTTKPEEVSSLSTIIIGTIQICGMALFTFIGEMPLIAHCGKKQNSFKGGAVAAFLLGYISIYFKNPIIRNLYPLSAGLSIVGFNGEGFVTDTTGAYSSSQSILLGVLTMLQKTAVDSELQVNENDTQIHIKGREFAYTIDKRTALFTEMKFAGREYLNHPMELNIWRAPTDNDMYIKV